MSPLSQAVTATLVKKTKQPKRMGVKVFNDLIHTHITIEGLCLEIVNTPQVHNYLDDHALIHSLTNKLTHLVSKTTWFEATWLQ